MARKLKHVARKICLTCHAAESRAAVVKEWHYWIPGMKKDCITVKSAFSRDGVPFVCRKILREKTSHIIQRSPIERKGSLGDSLPSWYWLTRQGNTGKHPLENRWPHHNQASHIEARQRTARGKFAWQIRLLQAAVFGSGAPRQISARCENENTVQLTWRVLWVLQGSSANLENIDRLTPGLAETVLQYKLAHREEMKPRLQTYDDSWWFQSPKHWQRYMLHCSLRWLKEKIIHWVLDFNHQRTFHRNCTVVLQLSISCMSAYLLGILRSFDIVGPMVETRTWHAGNNPPKSQAQAGKTPTAPDQTAHWANFSRVCVCNDVGVYAFVAVKPFRCLPGILDKLIFFCRRLDSRKLDLFFWVVWVFRTQDNDKERGW